MTSDERGFSDRQTGAVLGDGAGLPADYVELQLMFARRAAALGTHDFAEAMTQLTNLHRRLGFGDPTDTPNEHWTRFLDGLVAQPDLAGQVRWTIEFAASKSVTPPPSAAAARAGPFSVHVDGDLLRTHFVPRSADTVSPLPSTCLPQRRRELRAVLSEAMRLRPEVRRVRGTSWLYSTKSYCAIGHAATRGGPLTSDQHEEAKTELSALIGDLHLAEVIEDLITRAADPAEDEGLRGYDAVRFAAALHLDASVLTSADEVLCEAAGRKSMHVANPLIG